jgi:hypothetical protein
MKRKLSRDDIRHLHQLGMMKDKGILTAEEFSEQKGIVLNPVIHRASQPPTSEKPRWATWAITAIVALMVGLAAVGMQPGGSAARDMTGKAISQPNH